MPPPQLLGKAALRATLLAARRERSLADLAVAAEALATRVLALPEVRRSARVAAYVSVGAEPGTDPLLAALLAERREVLLPVLLPDGDLDWAAYPGPTELADAARGLREPTGPRLGTGAVATVDVVLVPGLAVSPAGDRLGRGGGSYDRALTRVADDALTCVLLHDDELDHDVPIQAHDRPVAAAVTPTRTVWFRDRTPSFLDHR